MNTELKGYLQGPEVIAIVKSCVSVGISNILKGLNETLIMKEEKKQASNGATDEKITELTVDDSKRKLVLLLSVLTPQTHELANRSIDNRVLLTMNRVPGLEELSASVYSNFDI
jgi:peroxin-3